MSEFGDILEQLKTDMASALPDEQIATRSFLRFDQRGDTDLKKGVWTIISKSGAPFNSPVNLTLLEGKLNLIVLYQFKLSEKASGEAIEEQELVAFDNFKNMLESVSGTTRCFDIEGFQQSMQIERPYGWLAISLTYKELD